MSFSGPKLFPPLTILTCPFRTLLYLNLKRVCNFSLECLGEMTPIQLLMGTWLITAVKCTGVKGGAKENEVDVELTEVKNCLSSVYSTRS